MMFGVQPERPIASTKTCWKIDELINKGDTLKLRIAIKCGRTSDYKTLLSKQYVIDDAVIFQLRMDCSLSINNFSFTSPVRKEDALVFCKFEKAAPDGDVSYCANVISSNNFNNKTFYVDGTWRILFDINDICNFDITIHVGMLNQMLKPFVQLYQDSEVADLKLQADDGYVKLHSAILAAYSPTLKEELCKKGRYSCQQLELIIPNVRQSTLQLLKEYLYLKNVPTFPFSCIMDLLQFASKYKMNELCKLCEQNLIDHVNAENIYELTEFAQKNQLAGLYLNILELVAKCVIETKDIKKHICHDVSNAESTP